ncbi:hypothetical protein [Serratia fonticola]|uniref:Uncharacterized protein n=1 Tax=Serratia fonticola TaxID=47917 RepID=A0AAW3WJS3_SERFO|nr:hypothetical protein [Serratia fonticola]MBC3211175.1 hypothetical protein [Serratia fonticola]NYA12157.1 hypothetical protein [Serratia fonticola]NYA31736.1 hypothetical protein [Serratia fonticola]PAA96163.1 hypothetical protein CJJ13_17995 [Serratia fonticola]CAI1137909.1 Uncharacterised protein [Serratia fonticola]
MKINELILKNGFTYQELLKLKNQYRDKKNETYGKGVKATDDESLKNYILLVAELCGGNMIFLSSVFFVMMFGAYFFSDDVKQAIFYFVLLIIFVLFYIWINSRGMKLSLLLTAKLVRLRFRMFLYRVSPPKVEYFDK